MKIVNIKDIETTLAHGKIKRKALVKVGELESKFQTVNYAWLEPNESFSPHKHDDCEEIFFILEGGGEFIVENKKYQVGPNDCIIIEKDEAHQLKNLYNLKLIFLSIRVKI
jgi:mannose-6-phosphate isomerase-like protein (cupin superfamily)